MRLFRIRSCVGNRTASFASRASGSKTIERKQGKNDQQRGADRHDAFGIDADSPNRNLKLMAHSTALLRNEELLFRGMIQVLPIRGIGKRKQQAGNFQIIILRCGEPGLEPIFRAQTRCKISVYLGRTIKWSEREDLNLRPLVSQTSA